MGYRIGWQCFETAESAHNYLLSQQAPIITPDGQLVRPVKQGQHWYLNSQQIQLSFPECSPVEQIQYGAILAAPFIGLFALVWAIRLIKRLLAYMGSFNEVGGSHD